MEKKKVTKREYCISKNAVLIAAGAAVTFVGCCALVKNRESISGALSELTKHADALVGTVSEMASNVTDTSTNTFFKPTGEKMTASALGSIVSCSAQVINKKIVEAGLAIKQGNGYILTDLGRQFGEYTFKMNKYDMPFTNIEWDKVVMDIIFTQEELASGLAEKARQDALMSA